MSEENWTTCPECNTYIDLEEGLDIGDEIVCQECGALLCVKSIDPVKVVSVDTAELDEDLDNDLGFGFGDEDDFN